jgi:hypothetical protein
VVVLPLNSAEPSIDMTPDAKFIGDVAEKCALVSAALGPVYVITPVPELYAKLPSPPASVTVNAALMSALLTTAVSLTIILLDVELTATAEFVLSTVISGVVAVTVTFAMLSP